MTPLLQPIHKLRRYMRLSQQAKEERRRDLRGLPAEDPGIAAAVSAALDWIGRAQDNSSTRDGGVSRCFSLNEGWAPSYPETTGYIIPTVMAMGERERARRMLDFLVHIQMPEGAFQGGVIGATPLRPTTFNTGQILLGLAAGAREFGAPYEQAMHRAARWLMETQDPDGAWRKNHSPFASQHARTYETHVAWGLFEAARIAPHERYGETGLANVRWALGLQQPNGWFRDCCLMDADSMRPLTHTIGYALRGVLEAYRLSEDKLFLAAAIRTADGLVSALHDDGFLPGRLDARWNGLVDSCCLTGSVQIARCWLMLHQVTGREDYLRAGKLANRFVRRTIQRDGPDGVRGGIKGSFPVSGDYSPYEYLNWAAKFFLDSCLLEQELTRD
jgi:hypothetical protein